MRNEIILDNNAKGSESMVFNTGAALLDAIVLAVVSREDEGTYGYKITQDVRKAIDVSESTLYPVLRVCAPGGQSAETRNLWIIAIVAVFNEQLYK